jgi:hypothetical protein
MFLALLVFESPPLDWYPARQAQNLHFKKEKKKKNPFLFVSELKQTSLLSGAGLPDGIFSNQKSQFG